MKLKPTTFLLFLAILSACSAPKQQNTNWDVYQGSKHSNQYSPLSEINKENVQNLKVAWTYHSNDADTAKNRTQIQCNPLIIDGVLYGSSPTLKFFALDAKTGEEKWIFDPFAGTGYQQFGMGVNRGLAFWTDGTEKRLLVCADSYLYCINAENGQLYQDFGKDGRVDLHHGLDRDVEGLFIVSNTPGVVYKDILILGARVPEAGGDVPGHIRAFNVKTGKQEWIFHTIPHPGELGYETWPEDAYQRVGGANAWAGISLDEERGMVFIPTGSASFDFYGGDRVGENLFANCILALNAETGEYIWHYQTVHHDLWDRDLPAPPNLVTVEHNGKKIDAVAQITKSSYVFLLDRETGEPLFPVEEVPVPPSDLEGESAWPTQPIPTKPPVFSRNRVTEADITQRTPEAHASVKVRWETLKEGPYFIPPSEQGSLIFPGLDGGGEWGGAAYDPATGNLIVNASEMPWILQVLPYESAGDNHSAHPGKGLYSAYCLACHGKNMEGGDMFGAVPALTNLKNRLDEPAVINMIQEGKGAMPSFAFLEENQVASIASFLLETKADDKVEAVDETGWKYPYYFNGYTRFTDHEGYPAITPPWGTLNAINLNTGEISWKVTLGEYPELIEQGLAPTGSESYGGPVVTAGGLIFMAGTLDRKFRVFDKDTGEMLWETKLPAAGFATPATYAIDGKQYVVVACGGGKLGQASGDAYVAFALEE